MADANMEAREAWLDALYKANTDLKFRVYYYRLKDADEKWVKDRELSMAEYYRALYTVDDVSGKPKATLPVMFGNTRNFAATTANTHSTPLQYVIDDGDWELYLSLSYYNRLIDGTIGRGKVDMDILSTDPEYVYPNSAIIPIGSLVLRYTDVEKVKKTDVSYEDTPDVNSSRTTPNLAARQQNLKTALKAHWDLYWVYGEGEGAIKIKIDDAEWTDETNHGTYTYVWEYNFEDLDEGEINKVKRVGEEGVVVNVPGPPSANDEDRDVTFDYYQQP
jgi:hypothetical protein